MRIGTSAGSLREFRGSFFSKEKSDPRNTRISGLVMTDFPKTSDVVIIGGGVIGLAIARELSRRGVRDVTLIERAGLGAEASSAAAGMLAPQAEADQADAFFFLTCRSRDMYPGFAADLLSETGIDIEIETTGTLYLGFTEDDARE